MQRLPQQPNETQILKDTLVSLGFKAIADDLQTLQDLWQSAYNEQERLKARFSPAYGKEKNPEYANSLWDKAYSKLSPENKSRFDVINTLKVDINRNLVRLKSELIRSTNIYNISPTKIRKESILTETNLQMESTKDLVKTALASPAIIRNQSSFVKALKEFLNKHAPRISHFFASSGKRLSTEGRTKDVVTEMERKISQRK